MIAVQDNGVGMDQATLDRAFDPFFTTKSVGSGTGLGLSQVYGFTKQSNGHVTLQSRPGEGTTVEIYLPRLAAEQEHRGATVQAAPSVPRSAPGGTVLVVEDNDDVRAYSVEALRELGYDPLAAKDGWAALHALDHQPQIKLLFADIGLPGGMDGWQLAHEAMRRRAGLKVLLTTGYASAVYAHTLDVPILTKPYTFDVLAATVGRVLGEPAP